MINIAHEIKTNAEQLVADIGKGKPNTELHGTALKLFTLSIELEKEIEGISKNKSRKLRIKDESPELHDVNNPEIKKVEHRLKLWANRPHQINHRILRKWLELDEKGFEITEGMLADEIVKAGLDGGYNSFYTNFAQMKTIADRNHGKVFDLEDGLVIIWSPVRGAVLDFKQAVFGN